MELKLWHRAYVSIVTKSTKFEPNRPTPISKPAPVSHAEALKLELAVTFSEIPCLGDEKMETTRAPREKHLRAVSCFQHGAIPAPTG